MSLKEEIDFEIATVLLEIRTGFDIRKFKALETHQEQFNYAKSHLDKLGRGSARTAFLLSNRHVLKMANMPLAGNTLPFKRGISQNEAEIEAYTNPKMKPILAKVFDFDSVDFSWIISELVRPLGYKEFFNHFNISNKDVLANAYSLYSAFDGDLARAKAQADEQIKLLKSDLQDIEWNLKELDDLLKRGDVKQTFVDYVQQKKQIRERHIKQAEEIRGMYDDKFFLQLLELEDEFDIIFNDVKRPEHWGKTADGRIVLLDYGYTELVNLLHY